MGKPLRGVEIRIADAKTGEPVAAGEIGVIEQRGDNVFLGYWEMPEKTAESFRDDGFFITGDMAQQDENVYAIVGTAEDLIISGGLNVYPKEVEVLIDEIDGVLESAVIGVPHQDLARPWLPFVPTDSALDTGSISASLAMRIAKFKQPKAVILADALPRNTMGKVQKAELRKAHADLFA